MTVKDFYDAIGADYNDVLARLMQDALILKFLGKYKEDVNYANLVHHVEAKEYKDAFMSVHTLKGLALNLGFSNLGQASSALTEYLRNEEAIDEARVEELMEPIRKYQKEVETNLNELL